MAGLVERMIGAACLNVNTYEEVEADTTATGQAMTVVILSNVAAGLGHLWRFGFPGLIKGTIVALLAWFVWAVLTYFVGTKIMPEPQTKSDVGELLRTIGFSSAPGVLRIFRFVPLLGGLISAVAVLWMLATMVVAVRQALDYTSTGRAVGVCIISWLVYLFVLLMLGAIVGVVI